VLAISSNHPADIHTDIFEDRLMDILLAEINAEAEAAEAATSFPRSTGTVLTWVARHRLSDEAPGKDDDDDDDDDDWDDEDLDDEDWDDEDLDDDDWDDDDDDDDWDDDDEDEEPMNLAALFGTPITARS